MLSLKMTRVRKKVKACTGTPTWGGEGIYPYLGASHAASESFGTDFLSDELAELSSVVR